MRSASDQKWLDSFRVWSHGPDYHASSLVDVATALGLKAKNHPRLKELLEELEEQGETVHLPARGWFVPHRERWLVGTLTVTRRGFGFVRPLVEDPAGDAFIPARRLKDAHHGDRVLAGITPPGRGRSGSTHEGRSGKILEVLVRSPRVIPGQYWKHRDGAGVVEPTRHDSLRQIWIDSSLRNGVADGDRVLARLRNGSAVDGMPPGEIICLWAPEGTWRADLQVVCAEHQLREDFPPEVLQQAEGFPDQISEEEISRRTDLRAIPFVTIDPEDAKDFDDAIALVEHSDGRVLLGVAIADVSHYVEAGDPIDGEAILRSTSVYIPGKTIPMLPERLSNGLCSLRPGEDRLAKVVWIEIGDEGEIIDAFVERAVIRSAQRFSYQQVQKIIDGEVESTGITTDAIVAMLHQLAEFRTKLRDRRMRSGCIDLDLEEMKLVLDDEGEVIGVEAKERLDAHKLVEECMLIANEAVATIATEREIPILRRVHSPPEEEDLQNFARLCRVLAPEAKVRGIDDLPAVIEAVRGTAAAPVVSFALLKTFSRAQYSPRRESHFALRKDEYCHFTSPIRRYPDLQVHRALDRHLFSGGGPRIETDSASLLELAESCSTRERSAESAERDMSRLRAISWLGHRVGERFTGIVTSVREQGFHVRLDGILIDGFVHVSKLLDDHYHFNETQFALRGANAGNMIRLGDPVEVELESVDPLHRDINLKYFHTRAGAQRGRGSDGIAAKKNQNGRPNHSGEEKKSLRKSGQGGHRQGRSGKKKGGPGKGRRRTHQ
ncbi:MAG: ribonuclease R [Planctomycetota bacterium]|nr:ribonuclease R [Planctomycetota bacterium]